MRPGGFEGMVGVGVVCVDAHAELGHHVVILVREVVAVDHVPAAVVLKLHEQPDRLALTYVDSVFWPAFIAKGCFPVAAEDLEVDQVDVDRVEPSTRLFSISQISTSSRSGSARTFL